MFLSDGSIYTQHCAFEDCCYVNAALWVFTFSYSIFCRIMKLLYMRHLLLMQRALQYRPTPVRCASSPHTSTEDWLHIWGEIIELITRVVSSGCSTTVKGGRTVKCWEISEPRCPSTKKRSCIESKTSCTQKPAAVSYPGNLLPFRICSRCSTICSRAYSTLSLKIGTL